MLMSLDEQFLASIGLSGAEPTQKTEAVQNIYKTLELRVAKRLAESFSDTQRVEFEHLMAKNNDAKTISWLQQNAPNFEKMTHEELERLRIEIVDTSSGILARLS